MTTNNLSQRIFQVWAGARYNPPVVPLIYYNEEYMAIINDSEQFIRFMSSDGQIFLALNSICQIATPDPRIGNNVYVCTRVTPILCSPTKGLEGTRDLFVLNNIVPLLI